MKKLINRPTDVLDEMLEGVIAIYPNLARLAGHNVLLRADADGVREKQVAIVSGGGSGHEPAHSGYIGSGMLSAAVAGEVFTSPSVSEVAAAIRAVGGTPGVLLIVKNYMGDRLNFGLAAEMARADGLAVETVIVADDIALSGTHERDEARGIAGTVLVHKIAGAAAASGRSLKEVAELARATAADIATMGLSLSAGTVPAVGKPGYVLGENEIELGLGIHGEPGIRRIPLQSADALADEVTGALLQATPLSAGSRVAVLVNNLGATTPMELAIFARRALADLQARGLICERVYSGAFMTSLEAAGASISLLPLDDERLRFLDAPTAAPAWPNVTPARPQSLVVPAPEHPHLDLQSTEKAEINYTATLRRAIARACRAIIDAEGKLTEMDRVVGDGDMGTNLARGARAILEGAKRFPQDDPGALLKAIGTIAQEVIGGSSGPLYGILLLRAGTVLSEQPTNWKEAMLQAVEAVSQLGGAKRGDRTMLDALLPFAEALQTGSPQSALAAAEAGAVATAQMEPRRGRSSYLGARALGHEDPGAAAAVIWLRAAIA
jgi:triose/dihydroxyacetone kinase / FAD-AMP lyase (cyclizing)